MVQMFGIIKGLMVYSSAIVEYRWNHWRKNFSQLLFWWKNNRSCSDPNFEPWSGHTQTIYWKVDENFFEVFENYLSTRLDGTWTRYLRVLAGCNSTVRPASSTRKPGNVRTNQQQIWAQVDCCLISREWVNSKLLRRSLRRQGRCQVPRSRWRSLGGLGQKSSSLENWLAKAHTRASSWLRLVGFEKVIKSVNKNNIPLKTKSLVSKSQTYSIVVFSV